MKYLEITDGKGFFIDCGNTKNEKIDITLITKDQILSIFDKMIGDEDISFDENVEQIQNPASNIIYSSLLQKFKELVPKMKEDMKNINQEFEDSMKKYTKINVK